MRSKFKNDIGRVPKLNFEVGPKWSLFGFWASSLSEEMRLGLMWKGVKWGNNSNDLVVLFNQMYTTNSNNHSH